MTKPDAPKSEPSKPDASKPLEAGSGATGQMGEPAADLLNLRNLDGKKKKKKRKYTRGLKDIQTIGRGLAKANRRIARAVASGVGTYYERDKKSSRKKRDGSIRDALKNWAKAVGKTARRSSSVPYDIADAFDTRTIRRSVRATVRFFAPPFFR